MSQATESTPDSRREPIDHRLMLGWLVVALSVAGIACRLAQFLSRQSFWEDEIAVLENVQHHPASSLPFVKLESYSQTSPVAAPPIFLWVTQWMGNHFNYHEYAVRLLPLVCSIAGVVLFGYLAWRVVTPMAAVWAVAIFAFSDPLIFQAGTAKPYSGDVFVAILIAWIGLAARPSMSAVRRLAIAAAVTAVALWLSYAAVFSFAAVAIALWPALAKDRARRAGRLILLCLPAIASFLIVYFLCIRAQREVNLDVYWIHMFPDYSRPLSLFRWFFGGTWEMFRYQMYPIGPLMIAAVGIGIWQLKRDSKDQLLIILMLPLGLNFLASCLSQYPYGGTRLTLFLLPYFALLSGIGATSLKKLLPAPWHLAYFVLALAPVATIGPAAYQLVVPRSKGNLRDAVSFLKRHRQPGETVYLVGNQTIGAASWYMPCRDRLVYEHLEQSAPIRGSGFWVVLSYEPRKWQENKVALKPLDARIDESRSLHISGADVCWFQSLEKP